MNEELIAIFKKYISPLEEKNFSNIEITFENVDKIKDMLADILYDGDAVDTDDQKDIDKYSNLCSD